MGLKQDIYVNYDASDVVIKVILSWEGRALAYFSEKLSDAKKKSEAKDEKLWSI